MSSDGRAAAVPGPDRGKASSKLGDTRRERKRSSAGAGGEEDLPIKKCTLSGLDEVEAVIEHGEEAWPGFIREYTPFILSCIRRFAHDYDERMEIYTQVCRRLKADDCRRIRQYRGTGKRGTCRFTTWLAAVTFNMAREWIRSERGRRRLFRSLQSLGPTDRLIFKYHYWEGYGTAEIAEILGTLGGHSMKSGDVIERLVSIQRRLNKDQRWRLVSSALKSTTPLPLDRSRPEVREAPGAEPRDPGLDPEVFAARQAAANTLRELVAALPRKQRVALELKFRHGLTARAVARALGIRNYKRVYEIQAKAVAALARGLRDRGIDFADFGFSANGLDLLHVRRGSED